MVAGLTWILNAPGDVKPVQDLATWRGIWTDSVDRVANLGSAGVGHVAGQPVQADLAIVAGFCADCVGWAFLAGYQAAIRVMVPGLAPARLAAFCVTESGGNRPSHIQTRVARQADGNWQVDGSKKWVALGDACDELIVAATDAGSIKSAADVSRHGSIRILRMTSDSPGLNFTEMAPMKIIPEVPHSGARFDAVVVGADAVLPGDGYSDFVKPFRTVEDICVNAAILAYLLRCARVREWPAPFAEKIIAALTGLASLVGQSPSALQTHLALTGMLAFVHQVYDEASGFWAQHPDDVQAGKWARDEPMFRIATETRALRAQRAWENLSRS